MPEGTPDPFADPTAAIADLQERLARLETTPATMIAEYTVGRLHLEPGDVLVVRCPDDFTPEMCREIADVVGWHLDQAGLSNPVLAVTVGFDLATLTQDDIDRAGAGGWPHTQP